jgi:hypothetical protein
MDAQSKKLVCLHLINAVVSDSDRRFDELKIAQAGKDWLDSLEPDLLNLLTAEHAEVESVKQP